MLKLKIISKFIIFWIFYGNLNFLSIFSLVTKMLCSLFYSKWPIFIRGGAKKREQNFSYILGYWAVIIRLLCNPLDALWLWHRRKRFVIVVYFKMAPQRDNRVKAFALHAGRKVSEVANLVGVSSTTVYPIKKRMDYGEGVPTDVQSVVERLFWIETDCGMLL